MHLFHAITLPWFPFRPRGVSKGFETLGFFFVVLDLAEVLRPRGQGESKTTTPYRASPFVLVDEGDEGRGIRTVKLILAHFCRHGDLMCKLQEIFRG